ncbi:hypothetical protein CHS0354_038412 [Potamilus streckersoni]|uniref:Uncharacterized protein n=1 Tax=Potamilus streckersoni TaxID=2493646 RepID=A0AAE0S644_9BIVA|nr:hypothetical protein CHS0354_038412 [Potamilus streckersoni]
MNLAETHATSFAYWRYTTVDDGSEALLEEAASNGKFPHAWCQTPNVLERGASEFTSPSKSNADTTDGCQKLVHAIFAAVETCITVTPYTVNATNSFWLTEDIFKIDLQRQI